jgi:UDP:flavonoid glycosyltransferase YjiC (YdhE family)
MREFDPHAVVADILTLAAALAAKMDERPWATLVPHVLPSGEPGWPLYSTGARLPRTKVGREFWKLFDPLSARGAEQGKAELNEARRRVGLPPFEHTGGGTSRELALIATFPQLEYPRARWEPWMKVVGPLLWEPPGDDVEPPPGRDPLVLLAPSTSQDPDQRMLRAALEGLAGEPVRVLASTNRRETLRAPTNATLVEWLPYSRAMPLCDAVVCHAGHGTIGQALSSGVPLVACPAGGDMAETTARVAWAGAGIGLPRRLTTPRGIRLAVRKLLTTPSYRDRAEELAAWAKTHDGPATAADELERFATASS